MITVKLAKTDTSNPKSDVGLELVKLSDGKILVSKVHDTSLFASSDIQPCQELVSVNGNSVRDMPIKEVIGLLRREVNLTIVAKKEAKHSSTSYDEDDIDACELGQFLINPCWFLYSKIRKKFSASELRGDQKTIWTSNLQQLIYLFSFYSVFWVAFFKAIPLNHVKHHLSRPHEIFTYALFSLAVITWAAAKATSPGTITTESIPKFDNYEYDGVLYRHGNICPTLKIRKLARSKYDRISQQHVPRFDHYCGWLGNTIGEENYRFFLAFLGIHAIMVLYGLGSTSYMLYREAIEPIEGEILRWNVMSIYPGMTFVCIFNLVASVPTTTFFLFHLSLIRMGMTTNEFYKWKHIAQDSSLAATVDSVDVERAFSGPSINRAVIESASKTKPTQSAKQFYNLGFIGNLHEVLFPRSLRMNMHLTVGYKES